MISLNTSAVIKSYIESKPPKTMKEIKQIGDTASHDRTYITEQTDIDDIKSNNIAV